MRPRQMRVVRVREDIDLVVWPPPLRLLGDVTWYAFETRRCKEIVNFAKYNVQDVVCLKAFALN
jgi:hypothetical protein